MVETREQIPLPSIEFRSADFDFAVDGIVFESASFIPDLTRIVNHNDLTFEQGYASFATNLDSSVRFRVWSDSKVSSLTLAQLSLNVRGLRVHARNIDYCASPLGAEL